MNRLYEIINAVNSTIERGGTKVTFTPSAVIEFATQIVILSSLHLKFPYHNFKFQCDRFQKIEAIVIEKAE